MTDSFYTISGAGLLNGGSIEVPCPMKLPMPGDILVFATEWNTPGVHKYGVGDEIHLMMRTDEAPWGKHSSLGNWKCITRYGVSVWSNIEWLIADGKLRYE